VWHFIIVMLWIVVLGVVRLNVVAPAARILKKIPTFEQKISS
jgi:hypothetical protein